MEAANKGFLSAAGDLSGTPARQSLWASLITKSKQAVDRRRLAEAAGYAREALGMAEHDWPDSLLLAESYIRLADLSAALDQRDEALQLYGRAIAILGELPDGVNRHLAHAVSNMGRMFLLRDEREKGRELVTAADALQRKLNEPDTASIKLNLAMAFADIGDDDAAERAFTQAIAALDNLEPGDLQGIALQDNYALYCLSRGQVDKAEILLRQCLILRQEAAGPRHPLNAAGLTNLARLLFLYRDAKEEAESLLRQAKDIYERASGIPASNILPALYYLARIAQKENSNAEVGRLCNAMQEAGSSDERALRASEAAVQHVTALLWANGSEKSETENRLRQALELTESMDGAYRRLGVDIEAGVLAALAEQQSEAGLASEAEDLSVRAAGTQARLLWAVSRHVFMAPD
jgi:tetratricopeptide (TPR) repeat protein